MPAGARINYSRLRRGASPTEGYVVSAEFFLTLPNGATSCLACCILPYLHSSLSYLSIGLSLSLDLFRCDSFFPSDRYVQPPYATILSHREPQLTHHDPPVVQNDCSDMAPGVMVEFRTEISISAICPPHCVKHSHLPYFTPLRLSRTVIRLVPHSK